MAMYRQSAVNVPGKNFGRRRAAGTVDLPPASMASKAECLTHILRRGQRRLSSGRSPELPVSGPDCFGQKNVANIGVESPE